MNIGKQGGGAEVESKMQSVTAPMCHGAQCYDHHIVDNEGRGVLMVLGDGCWGGSVAGSCSPTKEVRPVTSCLAVHQSSAIEDSQRCFSLQASSTSSSPPILGSRFGSLENT
jgi:hypothetical protein